MAYVYQFHSLGPNILNDQFVGVERPILVGWYDPKRNRVVFDSPVKEAAKTEVARPVRKKRVRKNSSNKNHTSATHLPAKPSRNSQGCGIEKPTRTKASGVAKLGSVVSVSVAGAAESDRAPGPVPVAQPVPVTTITAAPTPPPAATSAPAPSREPAFKSKVFPNLVLEGSYDYLVPQTFAGAVEVGDPFWDPPLADIPLLTPTMSESEMLLAEVIQGYFTGH